MQAAADCGPRGRARASPVGVRACESQRYRWNVLTKHSSTVRFVSERCLASVGRFNGSLTLTSLVSLLTRILLTRGPRLTTPLQITGAANGRVPGELVMIFPILRSPKAPETCTIGFHGRYIVTEMAVVGSPVSRFEVQRRLRDCDLQRLRRLRGGSGRVSSGVGVGEVAPGPAGAARRRILIRYDRPAARGSAGMHANKRREIVPRYSVPCASPCWCQGLPTCSTTPLRGVECKKPRARASWGSRYSIPALRTAPPSVRIIVKKVRFFHLRQSV